MATVIFSNMGDTDTAVLRNIWLGMPKVKVIEITHQTENPIPLVNEAIANEHDTLIMCGHGMPNGLLNPSFKGGTYLVDQNTVDLIHCNRVIGIWCHAKDFAEQYGVKGFWSSMFISNSGEARSNGITTVSGKSITDQEILFCIRLNALIRTYAPMKTWISKLREDADYDNPVVKFNYDGLRYYKVAPIPKPMPKYDYNYIYASECERWGIDPESYYEDDWDDIYYNCRQITHNSTSVGGIRKTSLTEKVEENFSPFKRKYNKMNRKKHELMCINDIVLEDADAEEEDNDEGGYTPEVHSSID